MGRSKVCTTLRVQPKVDKKKKIQHICPCTGLGQEPADKSDVFISLIKQYKSAYRIGNILANKWLFSMPFIGWNVSYPVFRFVLLDDKIKICKIIVTAVTQSRMEIWGNPILEIVAGPKGGSLCHKCVRLKYPFKVYVKAYDFLLMPVMLRTNTVS